MNGEIRISIGTRDVTVTSVAPITFGRAGDLVFGEDNRRVHRVMGTVSAAGTKWAIENRASSFRMAVVSLTSGTMLTVQPGESAVLPAGEGEIVFDIGPEKYRLTYRSEVPDVQPVATSPLGDPTIDSSPLKFRDEQKLLLVALAEPALRSPGVWPPPPCPPNRQVAARLGWKVTKFNRKLDYLCKRLTKMGIDGLVGDTGLLATDRRGVLVRWALSTGTVREADLALLDAPSTVGSST